MNKEVIKISLSALFADLGYQGLISLFPLLVVIELNISFEVYGVIEALSYGLGAFFGFLGGILGDRFGRKRVSVIGNLLMILMSISALPYSAILTPALFILGWWMRNFRTPPRRAMIAEVSSSSNEVKFAFGILHALDIGGGVVSVAIAVVLLYNGLSIQEIYLLSIPFFIISTLILASVNAGNKVNNEVRNLRRSLDSRVLVLSIASSLFGITSFSFGFPILTIFSRSSSDIISIASYGIFLATSALTGIIISRIAKSGVYTLAILGYGSSAIGSILMATSTTVGLLYLGSFLLGLSTGVVETLEPYLVTSFSNIRDMGTAMGLVTAGRSVGLFISNILMGFLFTISQFYAYMYSLAASITAALITILILSRRKD